LEAFAQQRFGEFVMLLSARKGCSHAELACGGFDALYGGDDVGRHRVDDAGKVDFPSITKQCCDALEGVASVWCLRVRR
jgi:hypothetical protein